MLIWNGLKETSVLKDCYKHMLLKFITTKQRRKDRQCLWNERIEKELDLKDRVETDEDLRFNISRNAVTKIISYLQVVTLCTY